MGAGAYADCVVLNGGQLMLGEGHCDLGFQFSALAFIEGVGKGMFVAQLHVDQHLRWSWGWGVSTDVDGWDMCCTVETLMMPTGFPRVHVVLSVEAPLKT